MQLRIQISVAWIQVQYGDSGFLKKPMWATMDIGYWIHIRYEYVSKMHPRSRCLSTTKTKQANLIPTTSNKYKEKGRKKNHSSHDKSASTVEHIK